MLRHLSNLNQFQNLKVPMLKLSERTLMPLLMIQVTLPTQLVAIQLFSGLKMVTRQILKNIKEDDQSMISKNGSRRTGRPQQRTNCNCHLQLSRS